jgi:serine/threonine protein kinase
VPFDLPTRLGNYELLSLLGTGGMGEVYRARDVRLPRFVAIKVLGADLNANPELRSRFEVEARAISSLNHPNICTLHDIGRTEGVDYLVMEFLEGDTLERRLRQAPLSVEQSVLYGIQIADALDQAHRRGIVHRDLKPGNFMLTGSRVKVMDFGLAKVAEQPAAFAVNDGGAGPRMTRRGTILGTPSYMAPEQVRGMQADARTDIFALGAVIYEMILGRRAFEGATEADVSAAILSSEVPGLAAQSDAPLTLDHVVQRCLAKDPNERWQTARDLLLELEWIGETASAAPVPSSRPRAQYLHWALAAAVAVAFVCMWFV